MFSQTLPNLSNVSAAGHCKRLVGKQRINGLFQRKNIQIEVTKLRVGTTHEGKEPKACIGKEALSLTQPLYDYVLAHTREPQILQELRQQTSAMGPPMQVSPDQGQFLSMLVQILGAVNCIEVGVFTGYSSLAVALSIPDYGRLVACDRDASTLAIARKYYELAGVNHKVDIRCGLAIDVLTGLLENGELGRYDFAFLDADKRNYYQYYELLLQLVRPGGLVVIDNVLWHGKVSDAQVTDKKTQSIREFNDFVFSDYRVTTSMIPIGDGMTLCRKH